MEHSLAREKDSIAIQPMIARVIVRTGTSKRD